MSLAHLARPVKPSPLAFEFGTDDAAVDALLALDEITEDDIDAFIEGRGLSTLDAQPFDVAPTDTTPALLTLDDLDRLFPVAPVRDPWEGVTLEWMAQAARDIKGDT